MLSELVNSITFDDFMKLDSKVRKIIINDPELLKPLVKKNMKEKRYLHSLSVANVCKELALIHHVDPNKAYMAGLLHDVCKFPDSHESGVLEEYLRIYDPSKLECPVGAYHSFVAKYYLREKCNFHDKDILNAIYNHTICNSRDKLSIILYIADKREPLREINDNILDLARTDLMKAYYQLCEDVEKYLRGNNERFVKNSV